MQLFFFLPDREDTETEKSETIRRRGESKRQKREFLKINQTIWKYPPISGAVRDRQSEKLLKINRTISKYPPLSGATTHH